MHTAYLGFEIDVSTIVYQQLCYIEIAIMRCYMERCKVTLYAKYNT